MSDFLNLLDSMMRGGQCLKKSTFLTQKLYTVLHRKSNPRQPTELVLNCSCFLFEI